MLAAFRERMLRMTAGTIDLTDDAVPTAMTQSVAKKVMQSGQNCFLTGPPGAGKSWLVRAFVEEARKTQKVAITASTGIAGTHIGGMTLHSFAGLGVRETYGRREINEIAEKPWVSVRIRNADVLIIDEVSMLHPATFEAADAVCKKVRRSTEPFGGLQVVLCGDFFQLPPVSKDGLADFIYGSDSWEDLDLAVLYLSEQFRQSDDELLEILHAIRDGEVNTSHVQRLQTRMNAELPQEVVPTRLHTHNVNVDRVNAVELGRIKGKSERYRMISSGPEKLVAAMRNSCLAPDVLDLKIGAAVMFVKNNVTDGYINGTLGTVIGFDKERRPMVKTDRGAVIAVEAQTWETDDIRGKKVASLSQLPLRLAWAISVHKSQGMSLTAAEIDLSNAFVEGLGYVALSRVTTMDGIRLLGLNERALRVSDDARRIDAELQTASQDVLRGVVRKRKTKVTADSLF
jgi:ATP-dependent exoDNAse (exonuclease V) alpha subunit